MNNLGHHANSHAVIIFDDIAVHADARSVYRNNIICDLEPKAFSVLQYLLAHAGDVVTKVDLLDAVWKRRCVTPNVLSRVIAQIRHELGDTAHHSRYIETVPTIGYRFIADIHCNGAVIANHVNQEVNFINDLKNNSALLEEVKSLATLLGSERHYYPAITQHLRALVNLFGDKPSGMVLYQLALEHGLQKLNELDLELPWRNGGRRITDKNE